MKGRWIKVYEDLTEWEWYKDPYVKGLFIHLILKANYKDLKFKGKLIKRGQLVTSIHSLATELGYCDTTVKQCLNKLKSTGEIKTKGTNRYTLITVVNYDRYQDRWSLDDYQDDHQGAYQDDHQGDHKYRNKEI